jgi:hypothetical protein
VILLPRAEGAELRAKVKEQRQIKELHERLNQLMLTRSPPLPD